MHEMSIALNVLQIAEETARQAGARSIKRIEMEIGELAGVLIDSLTFCFTAARQDTPAAEADLDIETIPGQGLCTQCGGEFHLEQYMTPCPHCGSYAVEIKQGQELRVKAIIVDE